MDEEASSIDSPTAPPSMEEQLATTPPCHSNFKSITPIWRFSSWHGISSLYDAYELKAITQHLNRTIQGAHASPCACDSESPLYPSCMCVESLKRNIKAPKCVTGSSSVEPWQFLNFSGCTRSATTRRFLPRLWMNLKRNFSEK